MEASVPSSVCGICNVKASKYTCPGCGMKTCELECVKKHKLTFNCDGKRRKTAFKSLSTFTDIDLLNDYRFLEEAATLVDNATRNYLTYSRNFEKFPVYLKRLVSECKHRRNIDLKISPNSISNGTNNKTFFNFKYHKIFWFIDWEFADAGITLSEKGVSENASIERILSKFFKEDYMSDRKGSDFAMYYCIGMDGVEVLMKKEGEDKYYQLSKQISVRDNLAYKSIVDYPTLTVVLKENLSKYSILNPADMPGSKRFRFEKACTKFVNEPLTAFGGMKEDPVKDLSITDSDSSDDEPIEKKIKRCIDLESFVNSSGGVKLETLNFCDKDINLDGKHNMHF